MAAESREGEVEYTAARNQIESEIESYMRSLATSTGGDSEIALPRFSYEKGETIFAFSPRTIDALRLVEALMVIRRYIEYVYIHTFEPNYMVFRSLGNDLYNTRQFSKGIKFRFTFYGDQPSVEATRSGNLVQEEIQACIALFKHFHHQEGGAAGDKSIVAKLQQLGVQVWQKSDEEQGTTGSDAAAGVESGEQSATHYPIEDLDRGVWRELAGYREAKGEVLESIILPLQHPAHFLEVARASRGKRASEDDLTSILPRAILFEGPPGVGKTTMARIIAWGTGLPLVYVPIENILSKYYGESSQNLAKIFDTAAKFERVILFLDEIDSLAGSREGGMFEATRRLLSVLLRKLDGFEKQRGVLMIGATNRRQDLDQALLSRFDTTIHFGLPNRSERASIYRSYARHLQIDELKALASISEGLAGRTIRDICHYCERRHARELLAQKMQPSAPPLSLYQEITARRIESEASFNTK